jgi:hypothetical protein
MQFPLVTVSLRTVAPPPCLSLDIKDSLMGNGLIGGLLSVARD